MKMKDEFLDELIALREEVQKLRLLIENGMANDSNSTEAFSGYINDVKAMNLEDDKK